MNKVLFSVLGAGVLCLTASAAQAGVIDFDSLSATTQLSGTPPSAAVLTDDLDSLGIVFGRSGVSTGVAVINDGNAFSLPNAISGLDANGDLVAFAAADIYFHFVAPGTATAGTTDLLSFIAGDDGGDIDTLRVRAYDLADNVIFDQTQAQASHMTFTISQAGIHRVWIENATNNTAGYLADNFRFNTPVGGNVVPLPPAAWLGLGLLGGLGLLNRARRRRSE